VGTSPKPFVATFASGRAITHPSPHREHVAGEKGGCGRGNEAAGVPGTSGMTLDQPSFVSTPTDSNDSLRGSAQSGRPTADALATSKDRRCARAQKPPTKQFRLDNTATPVPQFLKKMAYRPNWRAQRPDSS
jgi:hypothetical protein